LRVVVLAGGRSSEHDVSLASGGSIRDGLLEAGHDVVWVEIGRDGVWRSDGRILAVTPGQGLLDGDVAFPALHGPFGEDGTVQGMLETLEIPYVGAGVTASAVCLDKVLFKDLMSVAGLPQPAYVGVEADRFPSREAEVLEAVAALGLPVFVKPAHLGSSLGIRRVERGEDVAEALSAAFTHDPRAIVEAMARGLEVECGVLELPHSERGDGAARGKASEPGQIVLDGEWYDYEAKYSPGGMELRVPAAIAPSARERVRELAIRAFDVAGCEGLARVDFFVDGEEVLLNELNTIPGFTPTSVYARLLEASGVPYTELLTSLCRLALERAARRRAYRF
jgi:D-alanine-D-alanine ligase